MPPLNQYQRDLVSMGLCPYCEEVVREWVPVGNVSSPLRAKTLEEAGIDRMSGHKKDCLYFFIRL